MVDADGSNDISFTEFFFFLTMLQIPHGVLRKAFKKGKNPYTWTMEEMCEELPKIMLKSSAGSKRQ
jgi:hypothetical protein